MLYVALAQAAVIALLVWRITTQADKHTADLERTYKITEAERRELLTRIQHPGLVPLTTRPGRPSAKPKDAGELAKVGIVRLTPPAPANTDGGGGEAA